MQKRNTKQYSNKTVLYVTLFTIFIVVSVVFWLSFRDIRSAYTDVELRAMNRDVNGFSRSMQLRIELAKQSLRSLADSDSFTSLSTAECNVMVKRYLSKGSNVFNTLVRTDKDGVFDCASTDETVGTSALNSSYPYIDKIYQDDRHDIIMSDVAIRLVDSQYVPYIAIHVPIFKDGTFVGTVGTALFLKDVGLQAFELSYLFSRAEILIVDEAGNVVYESFASNKIINYRDSKTFSLAAKDIVAEIVSGKEVRSIVPYSDGYMLVEDIVFSEKTQWKMFVKIGADDIFAVSGDSRFGMLLLRASPIEIAGVAFGMTFVVASLVYFVARRFGRG